jgi:hypothetical protein
MNNKKKLIEFLSEALKLDNKDLLYAASVFKNKPKKSIFYVFKSFEIETIVLIAKHFKLYSLSSFGLFCGVSRERSRQVFKEMGIIFKDDILTKVVYLENISKLVFEIKPLVGEEWKKLSCVPAKREFLISNKGRIAKEVKTKIKGIEFNIFEFLSVTGDTFGRKRVSIPHGGKTNGLYLHRLVAEEFCEQPKGLKSPIVRFYDEDYSSVESSNLYWCNRD